MHGKLGIIWIEMAPFEISTLLILLNGLIKSHFGKSLLILFIHAKRWILLLLLVDWSHLGLIKSLHLDIRISLLVHSRFTRSTWVLIVSLIQLDSVVWIIFRQFLDQLEIVVAEGSLRACRCLASISTIIEDGIFVAKRLDSLSFLKVNLLFRRHLLLLSLWSLKYTLAVLISEPRFNCNVAFIYAHSICSGLLHRIRLETAPILSHTTIKGRIVHLRLLCLSIDFRGRCKDVFSATFSQGIETLHILLHSEIRMQSLACGRIVALHIMMHYRSVLVHLPLISVDHRETWLLTVIISPAQALHVTGLLAIGNEIVSISDIRSFH